MALNVGELYASFGIDSKGLDKQLSSIEKKCGSMGKSLALVGAGMTAAITRPLVKMGKSIYEAGTNFEAQMSKVEAISGASGKSLEALTNKALEMGSTTQFTATEAGQALEYMAMAGWKDESMLAGLEPIMNLAAAAGGDLASTSDIVTDAMTAFGYTLDSVGGDTDAFNKQVTHFSDVLAAAATSSNTNVSIMGESFKYVATTAGAMGYSVDDVAVALGTMANAGIKGSQAGTALNRVLLNMQDGSKKHTQAMKKLGLSLRDANGAYKPLSEVMKDMRESAKKSGINIKELKEKMSDLDGQLERGEITEKEYNKQVKKLTKGNDKFMKSLIDLAGTRGLTGVLAIMNASDAEFDALTEAILHCDGATAKMAQTMLDNAKGDVTIFKSALEGLSITLWTDVAPAFREVVQALTRYTDAFRKSGKSNRAGAMKMAALAAAAGPVTAALGGIVAALPKMGTALLSLSSPMGIVIGGLGLFAAAAISDNNDIGQAFYRMTYNVRKTLSNFNDTLEEKMLGASDRMGQLAGSISDGLGQLIPEVMKTITTVVGGLMNAISENADAIAEVGMTIIEGVLGGLSDAMPDLIPAAAGMVTSIFSTLIKNAPRLLLAAELLGLKIITGILETDWLKLGGDLLDSISTAISANATNAQAIGDKIVEMINTYLTPENISKLLTNATGFAEKLFNTITAAFTTTEDTGVDVVGKIVEALNTALGKVTGAEFTGKLGKLAEAVINGIVDSIVSLGVAGSDLLVNIITGISTMLGNITSTDFDNIDGVAQSIMNAISTGIGKIGLAGSEIVTNIGTAIGKLLGKIGSGDFTEGAAKLATTLITGLGTAIGQAFTSAGDIVNAIAKLLQGAMAEGSGVDLAGSLAGLGASIIGAIADAIVNAANGATNLITAIGTLISTALSGDTIGDLSSFGQTILTALIEGLKKVGNAGAQIAQAIGEAMSGIDFAEAGVDLANFAISIIGKLAEAFAGQNFTEVMTKIGDGLGAAVGALLTGARSIVTTFVGYILSAEGWETLTSGLEGILRGAIGGAISFLDSVVEELGIKVEETMFLANQLGDGLTNIPGLESTLQEWNGVVDIGLTLKYAVEGEQEDVLTYLEQIGMIKEGWEITSEGKIIYEPTPEFEDAAFYGGESPEYQAFVEKVKEVLGNSDPIQVDVPVEPNVVAGEGGEGGEGSVVDGLKQDISEQAATTGGVSVDLPVAANVTSVTEGEGTSITDAASKFIEGELANAKIPVAMGVTANVTVTLGENNAASVASGLGVEFGTAFTTAISGAAGQVTAAAQSLVQPAVQALNSGSGRAFTAGANFGNGFRLGILSKASQIAEAAAKVVRDAIAAANAAQASGSPSKIMKKVGNWYGEGYENGIIDRIRYVKRAASGMASAAIEAMSIGGNQTPAVAMAGGMNARESIDYDRLAYAMSQRPAPVLDLDGKTVAEINANNTATAQNARSKNIALRYGTR